MKLHAEPWSWTLDQMSEGLVLTVVCGTVGLYERAIVLKSDEVESWQDAGPAALEPLVEAIRNDATGAKFADRDRADLIEVVTDDG